MRGRAESRDSAFRLRDEAVFVGSLSSFDRVYWKRDSLPGAFSWDEDDGDREGFSMWFRPGNSPARRVYGEYHQTIIRPAGIPRPVRKGFVMSVKSKATAEVFFTAFKALPKEERDEVLVRIAGDRSLRCDLLDLATIAERQQESSRPFHEYLGKRGEK